MSCCVCVENIILLVKVNFNIKSRPNLLRSGRKCYRAGLGVGSGSNLVGNPSELNHYCSVSSIPIGMSPTKVSGGTTWCGAVGSSPVRTFRVKCPTLHLSIDEYDWYAFFHNDICSNFLHSTTPLVKVNNLWYCADA